MHIMSTTMLGEHSTRPASMLSVRPDTSGDQQRVIIRAGHVEFHASFTLGESITMFHGLRAALATHGWRPDVPADAAALGDYAQAIEEEYGDVGGVGSLIAGRAEKAAAALRDLADLVSVEANRG